MTRGKNKIKNKGNFSSLVVPDQRVIGRSLLSWLGKPNSKKEKKCAPEASFFRFGHHSIKTSERHK